MTITEMLTLFEKCEATIWTEHSHVDGVPLWKVMLKHSNSIHCCGAWQTTLEAAAQSAYVVYLSVRVSG